MVFIVSTRRKLKSSLAISGVTYRFVYMSERKFFGSRQINIDGYPVNVSEPEKTIIDCLDRVRYCGGVTEVAKALWYGRGEFDFVKMADYARRNGNRAASQRLGYLLETLGLDAGKAVDMLRRNLGNRYAPLDTLAEPKGRYIDRWKVMVNVPENEILQWKAL